MTGWAPLRGADHRQYSVADKLLAEYCYAGLPSAFWLCGVHCSPAWTRCAATVALQPRLDQQTRLVPKARSAKPRLES